MKHTERPSLPLGASLVFLVVMFGTTLPTPLYPLYREALDLSQMTVTVIYAAYAAGVIGALLLAGGWSDQLGRRRILFAALGFSAASALVFLMDMRLATLLLGRVLSGISAGLATGTATVLIIELAPQAHRKHATLLATVANMGGLGLGPLAGGLLAQFGPWPTRLIFAVDLALLALAAVILLNTPETAHPPERPRLHRQRLAIPADIRGVFLTSAIAGFAGFAMLGLFTAVAPAFLIEVIRLPGLSLAGMVVFSAFAASAAGQALLELIPPRLALITGCLVLACGAALVMVALGAASLYWLLAAAIVTGLGQGISFRAGMATVSTAAPADRRAEITSSLFLVLYIALSLPVIGVGAASDRIGLQSGGMVFASLVLLLAMISLVLVWRRRDR